jgi:hypothetical protein
VNNSRFLSFLQHTTSEALSSLIEEEKEAGAMLSFNKLQHINLVNTVKEAKFNSFGQIRFNAF